MKEGSGQYEGLQKILIWADTRIWKQIQSDPMLKSLWQLKDRWKRPGYVEKTVMAKCGDSNPPEYLRSPHVPYQVLLF